MFREYIFGLIEMIRVTASVFINYKIPRLLERIPVLNSAESTSTTQFSHLTTK